MNRGVALDFGVVDRPVVADDLFQAFRLQHRPAGDHRRMIRQRDGVCKIGASVVGPHAFVLQTLERWGVARVDSSLKQARVESVDADMNYVLRTEDRAWKYDADQ